MLGQKCKIIGRRNVIQQGMIAFILFLDVLITLKPFDLAPVHTCQIIHAFIWFSLLVISTVGCLQGHDCKFFGQGRYLRVPAAGDSKMEPTAAQGWICQTRMVLVEFLGLVQHFIAGRAERVKAQREAQTFVKLHVLLSQGGVGKIPLYDTDTDQN